jgi:anti-sigma-K factor RskA
MITERHEELAALHALGLLEGAERMAFEVELAASLDLRALVESLAASTATLALAVPPIEPPAALKDRIMTACAGPESTTRVVPFPLLRYAPWAVAAALALTAAWLATRNLALQTENLALQTERELAEVAYKIAQNQLSERSLMAETMINDLGDKLRRADDLSRLKIAALASLAGNTKEAQVIAVWDPGQQAGLLAMEKLPAIADTQDYQIWIVDPAYKDPVNGGVFHIDADGKVALAFQPDQPVTQAAAFAISLEKKGGVPKAEGPIVMLGKF